MSLDLEVDFNNSQINGMVEHTFLALKDTSQVILDFQGLDINSVQLVLDPLGKPIETSLL